MIVAVIRSNPFLPLVFPPTPQLPKDAASPLVRGACPNELTVRGLKRAQVLFGRFTPHLNDEHKR